MEGRVDKVYLVCLDWQDLLGPKESVVQKELMVDQVQMDGKGIKVFKVHREGHLKATMETRGQLDLEVIKETKGTRVTKELLEIVSLIRRPRPILVGQNLSKENQVKRGERENREY